MLCVPRHTYSHTMDFMNSQMRSQLCLAVTAVRFCFISLVTAGNISEDVMSLKALSGNVCMLSTMRSSNSRELRGSCLWGAGPDDGPSAEGGGGEPVLELGFPSRAAAA